MNALISPIATDQKPQVIIIEDANELVNSYYDMLDIYEKYIEKPITIIEIDELLDLLNNPYPLRIFLVDINLGLGRKRDGLKMIEAIRKKNDDALIIVYTANGDKTECMEAGANHHFQKRFGIEVTFQKIREIIEEYLKKHTSFDKSTTIFYAEVAHFNEGGMIRLDCLIEGQWSEWEIEPEWVEDISNIQVDTKLKITYTKKKGGFAYLFEEVEAIPGTTNEASSDAETNNDLYNSGIWAKKPGKK